MVKNLLISPDRSRLWELKEAIREEDHQGKHPPNVGVTNPRKISQPLSHTHWILLIFINQVSTLGAIGLPPLVVLF